MPTILIVEDDDNFRDLIVEWLTFEKHNVKACSTGEEALQQLNAQNFDLVVLDGHLPDMKGVEVLKRYRSSGGERPVLMLTGSSQKSERQEAIDAGASDFVQKPFKLQMLSDRMKELIENTR
ncbi:MAG TPA: response regulator [Oculatellaceae cyanobacterium]